MRNRIQCLECGMLLESAYRHDFKMCDCSNQAFVDGGTDYSRQGAVIMEHIRTVPDSETESESKKIFEDYKRDRSKPSA